MIDGITSAEPVEIYLKGTFREMGEQYVNQYGERILLQLKTIQADLAFENPEHQKQFENKINGLLAQIEMLGEKFYPPKVWEMLNAMSGSSFAKDNNLTLKDFIYLDMIVFITTTHPNIVPPPAKMPEHCSYFTIMDQDKMGVGRNFDWPMKALHALNAFPTIVHYECTEEGYSNRVTTIGHAGTVSTFSTFNSAGLSWAINSANMVMNVQLPGGLMWNRPIYFADGFMKMFMFDNFNDLLESIKATPGSYPVTVSIAGPNPTDMASIEVCPIDATKDNPLQGFVNQVRTVGSCNVQDPKDEISEKGYVHTNLLHCNDWEKYLGHPPTPKDKLISNPAPRYENLLALVNQDHPSDGSLMKRLIGILDKPLDSRAAQPGATKKVPIEDPLYQDDIAATYYRTAFVPSKGKVKVSFQQMESMNAKEGNFTEWKKVRV